MIDMHSHIMPGVDDGAVDIYDTLEMLQMAVDSGVTEIVATPHCNIPGMYENYFGKAYIQKFMLMEEAVKSEGLPIKILPGMEVFVTEEVPDLLVDGKIMPLNQTRYVLVEFAFDEDPQYVNRMLRKIREVGAVPVIAHAERFVFVQEDPQLAYIWRRRGYSIQINKGSFLGRFGDKPRRTAYQLLSHNLVNVVASDAHGAEHRTTHMLEAYELLEEERGKEYTETIFQLNPERICANKAVIKREPIPFSRYEL